MLLTVTLNAAVDKRYEADHVAMGEVNRVRCTCSAGGKGLNVSRVAILAGEPVIATGFAGGFTGRLIEKLAEEDGIQTDFIHTQAESRTCINLRDNAAGIQTEFLENGAGILPEEAAALIERFGRLLKCADAVTISGSLPKDISPEIYTTLITMAKAAGRPVLLDTSGPALISNLDAAPDLIKPNQDEIGQITGRRTLTKGALIEAGMHLREKGIRYVVVSLGAGGSLMICDEGVFRAAVPKLHAVNTVGCGDAMLAALAIGIEKRMPAQEMLSYASAVSAANAMHWRTGYFEQSVCEDLLGQIHIEKIRF